MSPNTNWNDVNDPGFLRKGGENDAKTRETTQDDAPQPVKKEPEVRLKKAYWKEGADGYEFTKECVAVVEGEYLEKTSIKRVTANLYVVFNGQEEDLKHEVSGFLEDDGIAELKVKLFYGNKYYDALQEDPKATCDYILKKIRHSRGEKEIESEKLEMPVEKNTLDLKIKLLDDTNIPFARVSKCKVMVDGVEKFSGKPPAGNVLQIQIAKDAKKAEITVWTQVEADMEGYLEVLNIDPAKLEWLLAFKPVTLHFQTYPGRQGKAVDRGIPKLSYSVKSAGRIVNKGQLMDTAVETAVFEGQKLTIETLGTTYDVNVLPSLDSVNTVTGQQQRLSLLGYHTGAIDGSVGTKTEMSILGFQNDHALGPDAVVGALTKAKLTSEIGA